MVLPMAKSDSLCTLNFHLSLTKVTSSASEMIEKLSYFSQDKGITAGKVFEK